MTETNTNECIFCLKIIYDDTFDIIGEVTRQMLNALLLKVSLDKNKESVMCLECATKLQNAVDFKTACLGTDSKMSPGIELARISKDQKVCQFCRSLTQSGNCTDLQDRKESVFMIDMVQKHIPETNLSVSGELITCNSCMSSLQSLSSFITICSEIEEKINKMDRETVDGRFKLNYNKNFPLQYANVANIGEYCSNSVEDITMKNEGGCEDHTEIDNLDVNIKSEEIEIKLEYDGYERIIESSDSKKPRPRTSGTYCSYKNCKNTSDKCRGSGVNIKFFRVPKDEAIMQDTTNSSNFNMTSLHEDGTDTCQGNPVKHVQADKNTSETTLYSCKICPYKTKHKKYLTKHAVIHKDPSEVKWHRCELCSYKTTRSYNFKGHMQTHQNLSKIKMYKCERCSYETRKKNNLSRHMLNHQDYSEVLIYRCEKCSYETRQKSYLIRHNLIHEHPVYKCESCPYTAAQKNLFITHMQTHQELSELTTYKCEKCPFRTRYKRSLDRHMLSHQDLSEATFFKCGICSFETKYKDYLKTHMLTHQDLSEIKTYHCEMCPYVAKRRSYLRAHMRTHQKYSEEIDVSQVTVHKCEKCTYETKCESDIECHMVIHQNVPKVNVFKCAICSYTSKRKDNLKRHIRVH